MSDDNEGGLAESHDRLGKKKEKKIGRKSERKIEKKGRGKCKRNKMFCVVKKPPTKLKRYFGSIAPRDFFF